MLYKCGGCNWKGTEKELEFDATETCFGSDKIEICPKCGSYFIQLVHNKK
ncbi:hypothetical protein ACFQ5N_07965 [Lutibacter holmesii]|uniref:Uncharacterized protein n=1 Tax=Lutibacter holmesii TaxID=1137985 RepID=A0ABW3WR98_9FLAO